MTEPKSGREWTYRSGLFAVIFLLSVCCAYIAPRGGPVVLGVGFLAALPLMRWRREATEAAGLVGAFVLLTGVSILWSPLRSQFDPTDLEAFTAFKLLIQAIAFIGLALAAARLQSREVERPLLILAFSLFVLAEVLIFEGFGGAAFYQWLNSLIGETVRPDLARRNVAQGAYVLAVLAWPGAIILWRENVKLLVPALGAAVIALTLTLGADAPGVALLFGAVAFIVVQAWGRAGVIGVGASVTATWLLTPWLVLAARGLGLLDHAKAALPPSWDARIDIWTFAAERIVQKPLLGWGVGASRSFAEVPLHTHNAAIQHWLELGLAGALLSSALWAWLFWAIARGVSNKGWAAASTAALTAFLTVSSLSFSAWEEWWLAAGALGLLSCILVRRL